MERRACGRRPLTGAAARLVLTLLVAVLAAGCGSGRAGAPGGADVAAGTWERVGGAPLSPRQRPVVAAVGEQVLVVGGDTARPCPPGADCPYTPSPQADAAVLHVGSGEWRSVEEAPFPLLDASTAVIGDVVHVWADHATADGARFLAYDVGDDRWTELPLPPDVAVGEAHSVSPMDGAVVVSPRRDHEEGGRPLSAFDPASGSWTSLPAAPLPRLHDRTLRWATDRLVVIGAPADGEDPRDGFPPLVAASFDPRTRTWERLPDSELASGHQWDHWVATSGLLVDPALGVVDGGRVEPLDEARAVGGILDLRADGGAAWSALPPVPRGAGPRPRMGHPAGGDGIVVGAHGLVLDVAERSWRALPAEDDLPDEGASPVWAAGRLVLVGGATWVAATTELLGDAWIWTPAPRR